MRLALSPLLALSLLACGDKEEAGQSTPTDPTVDPVTSSDDGTDGTDGTTDGTDGTDTGDSGEADTTPPSVTLSDDAAGLAEGPFTLTFTFSEDVGDTFTLDDVSLSAGATSGDLSWDGLEASVMVEPPADDRGVLTASVATESFSDAAGNANDAEATVDVDFDTVIETVLFDFEGTGSVEPFGGSTGASIVTDPTDAANSVVEFVKPTDAPLWAGVTAHSCDGNSVAPMPTTTSAVFTVRIWSPDAATPVLLKIENKDNGADSAELLVTGSAAETWETLTFDLSGLVNPAHSYSKISVFPNFGTDGATAGEKTYYIDDIILDDVEYNTNCPVELRPHPDDAWLAYGGGTTTVNGAGDGGVQVGQAADGAAYIIPFVLPALPTGGYLDAELVLNIIDTSGDGSLVDLHGDLYGLDYRTAADVAAGDVVETSMYHADSTVDSTATLIVDDLLTGTTPGGNTTLTADDAALVDYVNAQIAAGAVEGDYLYLRISPDAAPPIGGGYNWVISSAVDASAPPERPLLRLQ